MKVTDKGQVTIPAALRERYGLLPGTEVEIVAAGTGIQVKPSKRASKTKSSAFDQWLSKASGSAKTGMSTDQILAATRGED
jgi:AbrB family looped-hinge helix DNA binding protein